MIIICIIVLIVLILSMTPALNITKKWWVAIWTIIIPHSLLITVYIFKTQNNLFLNIVFAFLFFIVSAYFTIRYNIAPLSNRKTCNKRINILLGGRKLLLASLYIAGIQSIFYLYFYKYKHLLQIDAHFIAIDIIITVSFIVLLYLNGLFRVLILSRRLNIIKRIVFLCLAWIPIVNIFIIFYVCHAATTEFAHESYKINQNQYRVSSQICQTKYPLVLLHGVGFRDLKYLNYWGRIPKELIQNGATIYYGNQEAWGTIESNAEDVKNKILEIAKETNAEKVNIIAHSKGGLDARYMISKLGMENYVASLTTISAPHRGSFVIDFVYRLPHKFIGFLGKVINRYFRLIGDKNPDFMTASKQFLTANADEFNKEVVDSKKVYYQSYATVMSHFFSDYILSVPFIIGRISKQENDGLVSPESAKWGEFKGTIKTASFRGISHGDIIDLRRNDYKGFDTREFYVSLVGELKKKGF